MKRLLIILMALLMGAFTFQACGDKVITDVEKQAIITAYLKTQADTCNPCKDYSTQPFHKLEVEMLKEMAGGYSGSVKGARYTIPPVPKDDAKSIWFDLDSLKHFIWEIEKNACGKNCGTDRFNPRLGVRIYYARYPATGANATFNDLKGVPNIYSFYHTAFMIPTYDLPGSGGSHHVDFDPTSTFIVAKCRYPPIDGSSSFTLALAGTAALANGGASTAFNHGSLCPPICDPNDEAFGQ